MRSQRTKLQAWLWGEILLAGLLGASLAVFVSHPVLRTQYDASALLLVLETTMALVGLLVAILAANRFAVDGLRTDLLLAAGFLVGSLSLVAFAIIPVLGGRSLQPSEAWAATCSTPGRKTARATCRPSTRPRRSRWTRAPRPSTRSR